MFSFSDHIQKTVDLYLLDHPDSLVCIVGDFNPNSTNILPASFKRGCGLTQTVKILTRDTGTLDWCLTNQPKMLSTPKQLPKIGSSDHYCFLVQQGPPRAKSSKRTVTRCDTRDSRIRKFGQWITSFSWHEIYLAISCKGKFERFHRTLAGAIDRFLPARVHSLHSTDKPWMTTKIKAWITKRQKCLASYGKDSPTFKVWRNKVQRSIKHCKRTFYNTKVKNLKDTNIGRWWKEVKNLSGLSNNEGQWYQQLIDGTTVDSVDTLCERINQFFIGLTSGFVPLSPDDVDSFAVNTSEIPDELFVSPREANIALRSIKLKKAPGPDGIPNIILKQFAFELAPVIADIYITHLYVKVISHPCSRARLCVHSLSKNRPSPSRMTSGQYL